MDFNQVKELIRMIDASRLVDFSIDFENTKINMSKTGAGKASPSGEPMAVQGAAAQVAEPDRTAALHTTIDEPTTIIPAAKPVVREGNIVESPLVGTFYAGASPDDPPFVTVGSKVKKGGVLCIIEAMKIMNEITSKHDGVVKEILVENGDMVEYGQHLFIIG